MSRQDWAYRLCAREGTLSGSYGSERRLDMARRQYLAGKI
jgi:hypothetical protein